jgi:hypothetical protein
LDRHQENSHLKCHKCPEISLNVEEFILHLKTHGNLWATFFIGIFSRIFVTFECWFRGSREEKIKTPILNRPYARKINWSNLVSKIGLKKLPGKPEGQTWKPRGLGLRLGFHPKHDPPTAGMESFHCDGSGGSSFPPWASTFTDGQRSTVSQ